MKKSPFRTRRDLEEARLLQGRLRQLFDAAEPGEQDPAARKELLRLCDRALLAVDDEYCQQQICEVERHAAKLFSANGVMFQRRLILDALEAIGDRLVSLQVISRAGEAGARSETHAQIR